MNKRQKKKRERLNTKRSRGRIITFDKVFKELGIDMSLAAYGQAELTIESLANSRRKLNEQQD